MDSLLKTAFIWFKDLTSIERMIANTIIIFLILTGSSIIEVPVFGKLLLCLLYLILLTVFIKRGMYLTKDDVEE